jgi:allantoinase
VTSSADLVISGARSPAGDPVDIWIVDGHIAEIAGGGEIDPEGAHASVDARGLHVLPGAIDPHVHFNEPGPRTDWEGWATGSAALAAGGITTALEMPLNASPPTTTVQAFDDKLAAASASSRVDFGLWGGIVPGNIDELPRLAERGVVAFKAFMSSTGTPDFARSDELTLYEAMSVVAGLPSARLVAVHAESETITRELAARARAEGRVAVRDYLDSRPVVAETEAIATAIELAATTGCPLHIVHVSSGRGVALVAEARARGVDVSCEVTAHHLLLTEEDAERLGAVAKCAPPLRPAAEGEALWSALLDGDVSFVVSDHSPSTPQLREGDAFSAWGGIAGCQSTLELLLTEGRLTLRALTERVAGAVARRFSLPGKGAVEPGDDADLVLVTLEDRRVLDPVELRYRHPVSPYVGRELTARVVRTLVRGQTVYADGELVGEPRGRLVTPRAEAGNFPALHGP